MGALETPHQVYLEPQKYEDFFGQVKSVMVFTRSHCQHFISLKKTQCEPQYSKVYSAPLAKKKKEKTKKEMLPLW